MLNKNLINTQHPQYQNPKSNYFKYSKVMILKVLNIAHLDSKPY